MSQLGPNFKLGDQDRIVNSFNKNGEFKYAMVLVRDSSFNIYMAHNLSYGPIMTWGYLEPVLIDGVCGVSFKGQIHFFGGFSHPEWNEDLNNENQHFGFDQNGNFVKYKNLDVDFHLPACINFKIASSNSRANFKPGFKQ